MSKYRQAAKIDANQPIIVQQLRKLGFSVEVGHDDILVGHMGQTYWFEIKEPEKALSKRTGELLDSALKPSQKKLLKHWQGHYKVVHCVEQILDEIGKA